ncbi:dihydrofolate reductase family protein [Planctomicrobium sp. SH668]|uniref:dihydrofolate reductase family protein n=1 Tax=Planctomicrobium sp. SH668 TaxID=3448126 RepID=UPI003F5AE7D5
MKTQYYTAASLDGFIADSDHSLEWLFQFGDGPGEGYSHFIAQIGAIAMGASTYRWLLQHVIQPGTDAQQPWPYTQPTWVFSHRELPSISGANIHFVQGDVESVHVEMQRAAEGKNLWIVGGGELVGQFYDQGLLDEILVSVAPVTLGSGAPVLPRRIISPPLRLKSVKQGKADFVEMVYEVVKSV